MLFDERQLLIIQLVSGVHKAIAEKRRWPDETWIANLETLEEYESVEYYRARILCFRGPTDSPAAVDMSGELQMRQGVGGLWRYGSLLGKLYFNGTAYRIKGEPLPGKGFRIQIDRNDTIDYKYSFLAEFII